MTLCIYPSGGNNILLATKFHFHHHPHTHIPVSLGEYFDKRPEKEHKTPMGQT